MSATSNVKYKLDIFNAITHLEGEEEGSSSPRKILIELKEVVVEELSRSLVDSNFDLNSFKSAWSTRIVSVMAELNLANKNKRITKKDWESVLDSTSAPADTIDEVRSSSGADSTSKTGSSSNRSSTSSLSYQNKLSAEDRLVLEANHSKINKKWLLKSGACVEDTIYEKIIDFSYEHPLHSYIINKNDEAWKIAFQPDEVEEIMEASSNNGFNNPLPNEMLDILSKLDKKKTFDEMYQAFKNVEADRYDQRTLYWLKESVLNYIDFFYDEKQITMYTEQDLLEEVYGFIRRSRTLCCTRTESASDNMGSSEAKNNSRTLGTTQALTRRASGDHADLVFKTMSTEVACIEIGLEDLGSKGTKELQEKLLKLPKMIKAFCARITDQYTQAKTEEIKIIGYVISGMYITALEMSFKKGSVALISSSERLKMPESIKQIPALLPPVLALVYNCTQTIKSTVNYIDDVSSSFSLNRNPAANLAFFPPCFVPRTKSNKKRKTSEV